MNPQAPPRPTPGALDAPPAMVRTTVAARLSYGASPAIIVGPRSRPWITFQLEYELTADAIDLGLDAALPPVIDLGSQIAEFGRGERI